MQMMCWFCVEQIMRASVEFVNSMKVMMFSYGEFGDMYECRNKS